MPSFLRLQNSGITPNQKSMILSSAGGNPSLDVMKRHMRRILQPCGMELKQDALVVKDDLLKSQDSPLGPAARDASGDKVAIGDANMLPKKKKKKTKKKKNWILPGPEGEWEHSQSN